MTAADGAPNGPHTVCGSLDALPHESKKAIIVSQTALFTALLHSYQTSRECSGKRQHIPPVVVRGSPDTIGSFVPSKIVFARELECPGNIIPTPSDSGKRNRCWRGVERPDACLIRNTENQRGSG